MSLSAQAKVLRALQDNIITRVGSDKPVEVNVRVIAATNKDLQEEIRMGNFREDLYHRLSVILIHVPSLDQRKDDIPELAHFFIEQLCNEYGQPLKEITEPALSMLAQRTWSGNIREFRNVIERLIILGGKTISEDDILNFVGEK
jgi:DNA-binding NtrC family response regulator